MRERMLRKNHFVRRSILRLMGIPMWQQAQLLDDRRFAIIVSHHAIQQAGERYRDGNPRRVVADVADALASERFGKQAPIRPVGRGPHKAKGKSVCAWTPLCDRVYILRRVRRGWLVVTALPTGVIA